MVQLKNTVAKLSILVTLILLVGCAPIAQSASLAPTLAAAPTTAAANNTGALPGLPSLLTPAPASSSTPATGSPAATQAISAIPTCTSPASLTPAETEGPYFKAGSPAASNLIQPGLSGMKLVLTGYVLTSDCQPVAHAFLDFWQANAMGVYDNRGYTLRGHQFTDAHGFFQLTTIVPGLYPGRTEHIHVKVQPPNGAILTTQLYFPSVSQNTTDGIFDQALLMTVKNTSDGVTATYNFVVPKS
jgi:protocatechuate 3,4-dioxygenase beta subunit